MGKYKVDYDDEMNFGVYCGRTIRQVMAENPSYLLWCHKNIEWFFLPEEIISHCVMRSNKKYRIVPPICDAFRL